MAKSNSKGVKREIEIKEMWKETRYVCLYHLYLFISTVNLRNTFDKI